MTRSALLLALLCLSAGTATAQPLAFTDVTVIDVAEGVAVPGQTVVVSGERIAAVGEAGEVEVPAGATVIDGSGRFLIPGLWDMHAHASRGGRAIRFWPTFVAHGVTGFRELGSYVDSLLYWRGEAARPERRAPRAHWGAVIDGRPPTSPFHVAVSDAAEAVAAVDSLADLGFDFVKVYERIPREAFFAAARRARERGIPFAGHVPTSVTAVEATDAGQASFEHVTDLLVACTPGTPALPPSLSPYNPPASDSARVAVEALGARLVAAAPTAEACAHLLDRIVANGTWLTPTLTIGRAAVRPSTFDDDPRMARIPAGRAEEWRAAGLPPAAEEQVGSALWAHSLQAVAIAHEAGVGILAGSDVSDMPLIFAGSGLHDELAHLVEAGLSPLAALQSATLNPARFMGRADEFGTVEVGKRADLVLLGGNPLTDIENVRGVWAVVLRGELLERDRLDAMVEMEWVGVE